MQATPQFKANKLTQTSPMILSSRRGCTSALSLQERATGEVHPLEIHHDDF